MRTSVRALPSGLCMGIVAVLAVAPAWAQSNRAAPAIPDYAAILGSEQVVRDPTTGVRRGLTQREVQQRIDAQGAPRTERQRRESRAVNESIHAMPATVADAFRQAKRNSQGIVVVKPSREELQPVVGVVDADGSMRASHDPADAAANAAGERP